MDKREIDFLANRLNYDATVFKGCTMNELLIIGLLSIGISSVISAILLQIILNNFLYGIALGFFVGGGLTYVSCAILEKLRRGYEKGYLQQLIKRKLDSYGFRSNAEVIRRTGTWMIGRKIR